MNQELKNRLHIAIKNDNCEEVCNIFSTISKKDIPELLFSTIEGSSILDYILDNKLSVKIFRTFVGYYDNLNYAHIEGKEDHIIFLAIRAGLDYFEVLDDPEISKQLHWNIENNRHSNPLLYALSLGKQGSDITSMLDILYNRNPSYIYHVNSDQQNMLHVASLLEGNFQWCLSKLNKLSTSEANLLLNAVDTQGNVPLMNVMKDKPLYEIFKNIHQKFHVDALLGRNKDGVSVINYAIKKGDLSFLNLNNIEYYDNKEIKDEILASIIQYGRFDDVNASNHSDIACEYDNFIKEYFCNNIDYKYSILLKDISKDDDKVFCFFKEQLNKGNISHRILVDYAAEVNNSKFIEDLISANGNFEDSLDIWTPHIIKCNLQFAQSVIRNSGRNLKDIFFYRSKLSPYIMECSPDILLYVIQSICTSNNQNDIYALKKGLRSLSHVPLLENIITSNLINTKNLLLFLKDIESKEIFSDMSDKIKHAMHQIVSQGNMEKFNTLIDYDNDLLYIDNLIDIALNAGHVSLGTYIISLHKNNVNEILQNALRSNNILNPKDYDRLKKSVLNVLYYGMEFEKSTFHKIVKLLSQADRDIVLKYSKNNSKKIAENTQKINSSIPKNNTSIQVFKDNMNKLYNPSNKYTELINFNEPIEVFKEKCEKNFKSPQDYTLCDDNGFDILNYVATYGNKEHWDVLGKIYKKNNKYNFTFKSCSYLGNPFQCAIMKNNTSIIDHMLSQHKNEHKFLQYGRMENNILHAAILAKNYNFIHNIFQIYNDELLKNYVLKFFGKDATNNFIKALLKNNIYNDSPITLLIDNKCHHLYGDLFNYLKKVDTQNLKQVLLDYNFKNAIVRSQDPYLITQLFYLQECYNNRALDKVNLLGNEADLLIQAFKEKRKDSASHILSQVERYSKSDKELEGLLYKYLTKLLQENFYDRTLFAKYIKRLSSTNIQNLVQTCMKTDNLEMLIDIDKSKLRLNKNIPIDLLQLINNNCIKILNFAIQSSDYMAGVDSIIQNGNLDINKLIKNKYSEVLELLINRGLKVSYTQFANIAKAGMNDVCYAILRRHKYKLSAGTLLHGIILSNNFSVIKDIVSHNENLINNGYNGNDFNYTKELNKLKEINKNVKFNRGWTLYKFALENKIDASICNFLSKYKIRKSLQQNSSIDQGEFIDSSAIEEVIENMPSASEVEAIQPNPVSMAQHTLDEGAASNGVSATLDPELPQLNNTAQHKLKRVASSSDVGATQPNNPVSMAQHILDKGAASNGVSVTLDPELPQLNNTAQHKLKRVASSSNVGATQPNPISMAQHILDEGAASNGVSATLDPELPQLNNTAQHKLKRVASSSNVGATQPNPISMAQHKLKKVASSSDVGTIQPDPVSLNPGAIARRMIDKRFYLIDEPKEEIFKALKKLVEENINADDIRLNLNIINVCMSRMEDIDNITFTKLNDKLIHILQYIVNDFVDVKDQLLSIDYGYLKSINGKLYQYTPYIIPSLINHNKKIDKELIDGQENNLELLRQRRKQLHKILGLINIQNEESKELLNIGKVVSNFQVQVLKSLYKLTQEESDINIKFHLNLICMYMTVINKMDINLFNSFNAEVIKIFSVINNIPNVRNQILSVDSEYFSLLNLKMLFADKKDVKALLFCNDKVVLSELLEIFEDFEHSYSGTDLNDLKRSYIGKNFEYLYNNNDAKINKNFYDAYADQFIALIDECVRGYKKDNSFNDEINNEIVFRLRNLMDKFPIVREKVLSSDSAYLKSIKQKLTDSKSKIPVRMFTGVSKIFGVKNSQILGNIKNIYKIFDQIITNLQDLETNNLDKTKECLHNIITDMNTLKKLDSDIFYTFYTQAAAPRLIDIVSKYPEVKKQMLSFNSKYFEVINQKLSDNKRSSISSNIEEYHRIRVLVLKDLSTLKTCNYNTGKKYIDLINVYMTELKESNGTLFDKFNKEVVNILYHMIDDNLEIKRALHDSNSEYYILVKQQLESINNVQKNILSNIRNLKMHPNNNEYVDKCLHNIIVNANKLNKLLLNDSIFYTYYCQKDILELKGIAEQYPNLRKQILSNNSQYLKHIKDIIKGNFFVITSSNKQNRAQDTSLSSYGNASYNHPANTLSDMYEKTRKIKKVVFNNLRTLRTCNNDQTVRQHISVIASYMTELKKLNANLFGKLNKEVVNILDDIENNNSGIIRALHDNNSKYCIFIEKQLNYINNIRKNILSNIRNLKMHPNNNEYVDECLHNIIVNAVILNHFVLNDKLFYEYDCKEDILELKRVAEQYPNLKKQILSRNSYYLRHIKNCIKGESSVSHDHNKVKDIALSPSDNGESSVSHDHNKVQDNALSPSDNNVDAQKIKEFLFADLNELRSIGRIKDDYIMSKHMSKMNMYMGKLHGLLRSNELNQFNKEFAGVLYIIADEFPEIKNQILSSDKQNDYALLTHELKHIYKLEGEMVHYISMLQKHHANTTFVQKYLNSIEININQLDEYGVQLSNASFMYKEVILKLRSLIIKHPHIKTQILSHYNKHLSFIRSYISSDMYTSESFQVDDGQAHAESLPSSLQTSQVGAQQVDDGQTHAEPLSSSLQTPLPIDRTTDPIALGPSASDEDKAFESSRIKELVYAHLKELRNSDSNNIIYKHMLKMNVHMIKLHLILDSDEFIQFNKKVTNTLYTIANAFPKVKEQLSSTRQDDHKFLTQNLKYAYKLEEEITNSISMLQKHHEDAESVQKHLHIIEVNVGLLNKLGISFDDNKFISKEVILKLSNLIITHPNIKTQILSHDGNHCNEDLNFLRSCIGNDTLPRMQVNNRQVHAESLPASAQAESPTSRVGNNKRSSIDNEIVVGDLAEKIDRHFCDFIHDFNSNYANNPSVSVDVCNSYLKRSLMSSYQDMCELEHLNNKVFIKLQKKLSKMLSDNNILNYNGNYIRKSKDYQLYESLIKYGVFDNYPGFMAAICIDAGIKDNAGTYEFIKLLASIHELSGNSLLNVPKATYCTRENVQGLSVKELMKYLYSSYCNNADVMQMLKIIHKEKLDDNIFKSSKEDRILHLADYVKSILVNVKDNYVVYDFLEKNYIENQGDKEKILSHVLDKFKQDKDIDNIGKFSLFFESKVNAIDSGCFANPNSGYVAVARRLIKKYLSEGCSEDFMHELSEHDNLLQVQCINGKSMFEYILLRNDKETLLKLVEKNILSSNAHSLNTLVKFIIEYDSLCDDMMVNLFESLLKKYHNNDISYLYDMISNIRSDNVNVARIKSIADDKHASDIAHAQKLKEHCADYKSVMNYVDNNILQHNTLVLNNIFTNILLNQEDSLRSLREIMSNDEYHVIAKSLLVTDIEGNNMLQKLFAEIADSNSTDHDHNNKLKALESICSTIIDCLSNSSRNNKELLQEIFYKNRNLRGENTIESISKFCDCYEIFCKLESRLTPDVISKNCNLNAMFINASGTGNDKLQTHILNKYALVPIIHKDKSFGISLHNAVMSGNIQCVINVLNTGLDINCRDNDGNTALEALLINIKDKKLPLDRYYHMIKFLISHGIVLHTKMDDDDFSPQSKACDLIDKITKDNDYILDYRKKYHNLKLEIIDTIKGSINHDRRSELDYHVDFCGTTVSTSIKNGKFRTTTALKDKVFTDNHLNIIKFNFNKDKGYVRKIDDNKRDYVVTSGVVNLKLLWQPKDPQNAGVQKVKVIIREDGSISVDEKYLKSCGFNGQKLNFNNCRIYVGGLSLSQALSRGRWKEVDNPAKSKEHAKELLMDKNLDTVLDDIVNQPSVLSAPANNDNPSNVRQHVDIGSNGGDTSTSDLPIITRLNSISDSESYITASNSLSEHGTTASHRAGVSFETLSDRLSILSRMQTDIEKLEERSPLNTEQPFKHNTDFHSNSAATPELPAITRSSSIKSIDDLYPGSLKSDSVLGKKQDGAAGKSENSKNVVLDVNKKTNTQPKSPAIPQDSNITSSDRRLGILSGTQADIEKADIEKLEEKSLLNTEQPFKHNTDFHGNSAADKLGESTDTPDLPVIPQDGNRISSLDVIGEKQDDAAGKSENSKNVVLDVNKKTNTQPKSPAIPQDSNITSSDRRLGILSGTQADIEKADIEKLEEKSLLNTEQPFKHNTDFHSNSAADKSGESTDTPDLPVIPQDGNRISSLDVIGEKQDGAAAELPAITRSSSIKSIDDLYPGSLTDDSSLNTGQFTASDNDRTLSDVQSLTSTNSINDYYETASDDDRTLSDVQSLTSTNSINDYYEDEMSLRTRSSSNVSMINNALLNMLLSVDNAKNYYYLVSNDVLHSSDAISKIINKEDIDLKNIIGAFERSIITLRQVERDTKVWQDSQENITIHKHNGTIYNVYHKIWSTIDQSHKEILKEYENNVKQLFEDVVLITHSDIKINLPLLYKAVENLSKNINISNLNAYEKLMACQVLLQESAEFHDMKIVNPKLDHTIIKSLVDSVSSIYGYRAQYNSQYEVNDLTLREFIYNSQLRKYIVDDNVVQDKSYLENSSDIEKFLKDLKQRMLLEDFTRNTFVTIEKDDNNKLKIDINNLSDYDVHVVQELNECKSLVEKFSSDIHYSQLKKIEIHPYNFIKSVNNVLKHHKIEECENSPKARLILIKQIVNTMSLYENHDIIGITKHKPEILNESFNTVSNEDILNKISSIYGYNVNLHMQHDANNLQLAQCIGMYIDNDPIIKNDSYLKDSFYVEQYLKAQHVHFKDFTRKEEITIDVDNDNVKVKMHNLSDYDAAITEELNKCKDTVEKFSSGVGNLNLYKVSTHPYYFKKVVDAILRDKNLKNFKNDTEIRKKLIECVCNIISADQQLLLDDSTMHAIKLITVLSHNYDLGAQLNYNAILDNKIIPNEIVRSINDLLPNRPFDQKESEVKNLQRHYEATSVLLQLKNLNIISDFRNKEVVLLSNNTNETLNVIFPNYNDKILRNNMLTCKRIISQLLEKVYINNLHGDIKIHPYLLYKAIDKLVIQNKDINLKDVDAKKLLTNILLHCKVYPESYRICNKEVDFIQNISSTVVTKVKNFAMLMFNPQAKLASTTEKAKVDAKLKTKTCAETREEAEVNAQIGNAETSTKLKTKTCAEAREETGVDVQQKDKTQKVVELNKAMSQFSRSVSVDGQTTDKNDSIYTRGSRSSSVRSK
ncbi:ankyrin repeat domain-containing protein [Candidatus Neoehrlichia procyonis]|uniref:Ankyrin repeats family protein n=1 Tax=Candidatus Neoehrlichia procyonis str. RAC413 TaxID=1359163 RepID=A0A0F3NMD8_9RICK|nr:ankyrin repeat domain-containing protein [Candidatus Neoehrlichia lotoris]KJV68872.1 ankyrin repeats family protein [Candidatus Neoehrlichia lotoris str. RAC413]